MAGITTHVLDNLVGRPGAGMRIDFSVFEGGSWKLLKTLVTNADGRTDQPVLSPAEAKVGQISMNTALGVAATIQGVQPRSMPMCPATLFSSTKPMPSMMPPKTLMLMPPARACR